MHFTFTWCFYSTKVCCSLKKIHDVFIWEYAHTDDTEYLAVMTLTERCYYVSTFCCSQKLIYVYEHIYIFSAVQKCWATPRFLLIL